jgi:hypothetical protein
MTRSLRLRPEEGSASPAPGVLIGNLLAISYGRAVARAGLRHRAGTTIATTVHHMCAPTLVAGLRPPWRLLLVPALAEQKPANVRELDTDVVPWCHWCQAPHRSFAEARGQATGLPSGEDVSRAIGIEPLDQDEVGLAAYGWTTETPLWIYILREAAVRCDGDCLGPVGARIVGEVLIGIIAEDPESFLAVEPQWTPTLADRDGEAFGLGDLLAAVSSYFPLKNG